MMCQCQCGCTMAPLLPDEETGICGPCSEGDHGDLDVDEPDGPFDVGPPDSGDR